MADPKTERRGVRTVSVAAHALTSQAAGAITLDTITGVKVGGTLRLLEFHPIRPGETVQGFNGSLHCITTNVYDVLSPRPIFVAGAFFVTMATLPESLKNVFVDRQRELTAALPQKFSSACFREIYNNYFAADDYFISSDTHVIQRVLPPIIRTMEVISDDEQQPTYSEWIYAQSGRYPARIGIERLSQKVNRSVAMYSQIIPGTSKALCHFGSSVPIMDSKNRATVEPGFLCFVGGFFHEPYNTALYGGLDVYDPAIDTLDDLFDGDKLRNADAWLQRQRQADQPVELGDIGAENVLNLFMNGSMTFHDDWDPRRYSPGAIDATDNLDDTLDDDDLSVETTDENWQTQMHLAVDASILSDLPHRVG